MKSIKCKCYVYDIKKGKVELVEKELPVYEPPKPITINDIVNAIVKSEISQVDSKISNLENEISNIKSTIDNLNKISQLVKPVSYSTSGAINTNQIYALSTFAAIGAGIYLLKISVNANYSPVVKEENVEVQILAGGVKSGKYTVDTGQHSFNAYLVIPSNGYTKLQMSATSSNSSSIGKLSYNVNVEGISIAGGGIW